MSYVKLIIDSQYTNEIPVYCETQGKQLQDMIDEYLEIMNTLLETGIKKGETADSLKVIIRYAEELASVVESTAVTVKDTIINYVDYIDDEDQYLL